MHWIHKTITVTPTATYNIWDISNIQNYNSAGVYVFWDNHNNIIYIGESVNLALRVINHIKGTTGEMSKGGWERIYKVDLYEIGTGMQARLDARFLEKWLIAQEHPYFNKGYGQTHPLVISYTSTKNECRWNWDPADQAACQGAKLPVTEAEFKNIKKQREKEKKKREKNKARKKKLAKKGKK